MKYGKLVNGQVLQVSSSLIPRLPQHYISLSCGVDVLLGVNGCIWITRSMPKEWLLTEGVLEKEAESMIPEVETLTRLHTLHASTPISRDIRVRICRVKNAIHVLEKCLLGITPERISSIVAQSESLQIPPAVK